NRSVFNDHIVRSRWLYQFDQRWSLRFTVQYNALIVNPLLTSLEKTKQLNGDILLSYRPSPGTALFVGYNYDVQNYDPLAVGMLPPLARLNRGLINDGRVLFVKVSYLFRYGDSKGWSRPFRPAFSCLPKICHPERSATGACDWSASLSRVPSNPGFGLLGWEGSMHFVLSSRLRQPP